MDRLRKQIEALTYTLMIFASGGFFISYFTFSQVRYITDQIGLLGFSWTIIPTAALYWYNRYGWKYINADLDFDGYWDFTEEQYKIHPTKGTAALDYPAFGHMKIVQDTRSMRIVEGRTQKGRRLLSTDEISNWWSASCELEATTGKITAALDHQSSPHRTGGAVQYGVEIFTPTMRDNRGRPIGMTSIVYHCIGHGEPRLVHVKYKRRGAQFDEETKEIADATRSNSNG